MKLLRPEEVQPQLGERYVYGIQCGQFIKVGVATDITKRMYKMRLENPHPLIVVYRRKMYAAFHCERKMHEILQDKAIGREWFTATLEEVKAAGVIGIAHAREVWRGEVAMINEWRTRRALENAEARKLNETNQL